LSFFTRAFRAQPEPVENRNLSISDPRAEFLFGHIPATAGVSVTEFTAMGLPAVWAAVGLISGNVAGLPLRAIRDNPDGTCQRVPSWLDNPAGPDGPTAFEWVEDIVVSLLVRGNYFGLKVFGGAHQLQYVQPIPHSCCLIEVKDGRKFYRVAMADGTSQLLTDNEILHIPALSLDGIRGLSPITIARESLGISIAGEKAAAGLFRDGALMSGIISPTIDMTPAEAAEAGEVINRSLAGVHNAGKIAFLNKSLSFSQCSVSPADAQFIDSRKLQLSDVGRLFRVPPHLIGNTDASSSWGQGLIEQTLAYQKYTLGSWTSRIEARLSRLLPDGIRADFDYHRLLAGSPKEQTQLLIAQTAGQPVITVNEARAALDRAPIEGGDVLGVAANPIQETPTAMTHE
jgi:HK97 family phage portal protein